jgi:hypothetical protein
MRSTCLGLSWEGGSSSLVALGEDGSLFSSFFTYSAELALFSEMLEAMDELNCEIYRLVVSSTFSESP